MMSLNGADVGGNWQIVDIVAFDAAAAGAGAVVVVAFDRQPF